MAKVDAALAWAARGYRVFPCIPNTKRPLFEEWQHAASTDPFSIRAWWGLNGTPEANIGVCLDDKLVLDLDTKAGREGVEDFYKLGLDFDTLTVATPSGGFHVYYSAPPTANSAGKLGPGIDTRGPHGYVLAPGSTIEGREYAIVYDRPLQQAPERIVQAIGAPRDRATSEQAVAELDTPAAIQATIDYLRDAPAAVEGSFGDNTTYAICCEVRDRGVSEEMALQLLWEHWNEKCSPPWSFEELSTKVDSAYRHAQNPMGAKAPEALFGGVVVPPPPVTAEAPAIAPAIFGNIIPATALQPRRWVLRRALLRGEITVLDGPGGVSKSTFILTLAAYLVQGLNFLDWENCVGPCKAIIHNSEDSLEELSMRLHAICYHHGFDVQQVAARIALLSGKSREAPRLKLAIGTGGRGDPVLGVEATMRFLVETARSTNDVALLGLDPLAKLHGASENDNTAMSAVMDVLEAVVSEADVGGLTAHHTAKAVDAKGGRGASSITDSARVALSLRGPSDEDSVLYGIDAAERELFVRLDDGKMNRSLRRSEPLWLRKVGVRLVNTETIGVLEKVDMTHRALQLRRQLAETLHAEITSKGVAMLSFADAVKLVRASDASWGLLGLPAAKVRMQTMLRQPIELEDGRLVSLQSQDHKPFVVIS